MDEKVLDMLEDKVSMLLREITMKSNLRSAGDIELVTKAICAMTQLQELRGGGYSGARRGYGRSRDTGGSYGSYNYYDGGGNYGGGYSGHDELRQNILRMRDNAQSEQERRNAESLLAMLK